MSLAGIPADLRVVHTPRLTLEALGPQHTDDLRALLNDPRVARTLSPDGRPPAPGLERSALRAKQLHWDRFGFGLWLMRDRSTGIPVGRGGLQHTTIDHRDELEIAWAVVPERWGEGLATELANRCVEIALNDCRRPDVVAITQPGNIASRRVMEKAGLRYEHQVTHAGLAHVMYRRSR